MKHKALFINETQHDPSNENRYEMILKALIEDFEKTAVERDRKGGTAKRERDLLRKSGLLTLLIPCEYGGQGESWRTIYLIIRRIAEVDSSLAHLFAFHHLQVATIDLYGNAQQKSHYFTQTVTQSWFWGNAINSEGKGVKAEVTQHELIISGMKRFCSGATDSDMLTVSTVLETDDTVGYVAVTPTQQPGITVHNDWDNMGQRQTDSGRVSFDKVAIAWNSLLTDPGPGGTLRATLRVCISQLILVNLYLGIAQGAFEAARDYTRTKKYSTEAEPVTEDPYILHRYGNMWLQLKSAIALADAAACLLNQALERGDEITEEERGHVSIAISEAKLIAARAGLDISNQLFDVAGASATTSKLGLDRFWRNIRTHSLHDSLDDKLREIGDWALNEMLPTPGSYS